MRAVKGFHILTLLANSYTTKTNQKNNHTWKFHFHLLPSSISFYWGSIPQAQRSYKFPCVKSRIFISDHQWLWKGGSLTKHTWHCYQTKTFCIDCRKIFFHPFHCITWQVAHWPGTNLCQPYIGQWRGFRENNTTNHQSEKRRGNRGHWLCTGFNGAVFCQMACLAAAVAVGLSGFTASHSDMTNLTTSKREISRGRNKLKLMKTTSAKQN